MDLNCTVVMDLCLIRRLHQHQPSQLHFLLILLDIHQQKELQPQLPQQSYHLMKAFLHLLQLLLNLHHLNIQQLRILLLDPATGQSGLI
ncbi:hypothetical protein GDO81_016243 [Engystomops pustulosus]|uniref:Uncharacterized protein n=1 Tax=Engystomops pustulosus TaxID=76066 RepID=A0AAV7AYJ5_ENGPU|nr:hypothetical protein GDO81_016243 [Engystomops pustulosus]